MDRITKSLLDEFARQYELTELPEHKQFESFATFLALSRNYAETIEPGDLTTGDGNDTGIDGAAILLNGALANDPDTVTELSEAAGFVDVDFVFVQAERSAAFDGAKIGTFGFGVVDFFSDAPKLPRNQAITDAAKTMERVFEYSAKFRRRPSCKMYYVTTGTWRDDAALTGRITAVQEDLRALNIFDDIQFFPIDAAEIQRLYALTKNAIARVITFADRTPIPEMPGVSEAYLGIIPATTFLSLMEDEKVNW
jgi:hypothetical protein